MPARPMLSPYDLRYRPAQPEQLVAIAAQSGLVFYDVRHRVAVKFRPDPDSPGWVHGWAEVSKVVVGEGNSPVRLEEFYPPVHYHGAEEVPEHACTYAMAVFLACGRLVVMMSAEQLQACVDAQNIQPAHALRGQRRSLGNLFTHW